MGLTKSGSTYLVEPSGRSYAALANAANEIKYVITASLTYLTGSMVWLGEYSPAHYTAAGNDTVASALRRKTKAETIRRFSVVDQSGSWDYSVRVPVSDDFKVTLS